MRLLPEAINISMQGNYKHALVYRRLLFTLQGKVKEGVFFSGFSLFFFQ